MVETALESFNNKLKNVQNIEQENISQYLVEASIELLQNSKLENVQIDKILNSDNSQIVQAAFQFHFKEMGVSNTFESDKIEPEAKAPEAPYQPKLTIINSTPCTVNVIQFMHTALGNCGFYYYPKNAIAASQGISTYSNGFASFPNNTWYNNLSTSTVTTAFLVNQGFKGYYQAFKYLVGTICSNISIGFCGAAQGASYTQMCNGCNGGGNFYTSTLISNSGSNPDSPQMIDQDMTLIIIQN